MITLAQKDLPPGKNDYVLQNSLTPSSQVEALCTFAIQELELRTFGIFYPNSPYGLHFKTLFTQEVTRRGAKITGAVAYQEGQMNFSEEIKTFFRIKTHRGPDSAKKREEEFVSGLSVDGLFIPDTYDRAASILVQTDYYNVRNTVFLGTNAWNHPALLSIAGKSAEGAIFVDAFSVENPSQATVHFLKEFRKHYSRDPATLEALGYEAAEFLREILRHKSVTTPAQLKDEIYRVQNFQGASGLNRYVQGGKTHRTLSILRVNKGRIEHFSR